MDLVLVNGSKSFLLHFFCWRNKTFASFNENNISSVYYTQIILQNFTHIPKNN